MQVDTRPVGSNPEDLRELAVLFDAQRNTRHCWCTAFCLSGGRFAVGWFTGGNRKRFERTAASSTTPMGVLSSVDGSPAGWCACGPRSRYTAAIDGRSRLLRGRSRDEDHRVWLIACPFVAAPYRNRGITHTLVRTAVDLARQYAALAIEGWPLAESAPRSADAFLGREEVFRGAGFTRVDQPSTQRAMMRLDLDGAAPAR